MQQKRSTFIFDLNGTMIDDMDCHITAWSEILNNELGACLTTEDVKAQLYGKNDEFLIRVFGKNHFTKEKMLELSTEKEKRYQKKIFPRLKLIKGLAVFLDASFAANIPLAIGSAAISFNIDFVLDNLNIRKYFSAIVSAEDVQLSKPDPETFLKAAEMLNVSPNDCIVFEDTPKGVEAALNAGMKAVVLTTMHQPNEFEVYPNVIGFMENYHHAHPSDFATF